MATPKQLAALKKARAARRKNLKLKTNPGKRKAPAKKAPAKKVPGKKYVVRVTTQDNRKGYLATGGLDTDIEKAQKLLLSVATKKANAFFTANKKHLHKVEVLPVKKPNGTGYKKNPVPQSSKAKIKEAAQLFEDFTGHDATYFDEVPVKWPDVAIRVGQCDGILYETVRDGKTEHYVHRFKKSARPTLVASHNGKHLGLIGGKFTFTERGIVDN